jgi:hypothetical protein
VVRQLGQALGQLEGSLLAPEAQQPRQALARGALRLLGARQAQRRVGIEGLFAQPACRAC